MKTKLIPLIFFLCCSLVFGAVTNLNFISQSGIVIRQTNNTAAGSMDVAISNTVAQADAPLSTNFYYYVATTNVTSITVQSIPQTWNTIEVTLWGRGGTAGSADNFYVRVNDITSAKYFDEVILGSGASAVASYTAADTGALLGVLVNSNSQPAALSGYATLTIPEYTNNYFSKGGLSRYTYLRNTNATVAAVTALNGFFIDTLLPVTNLTIYASGTGSALTGSVFKVTLRNN